MITLSPDRRQVSVLRSFNPKRFKGCLSYETLKYQYQKIFIYLFRQKIVIVINHFSLYIISEHSTTNLPLPFSFSTL